MWEAIRANRQRSRVLISAMGAILIAMGAVFGYVYSPEYGAAAGAVFALGLWGVMVLIAFAGGDKVLLLSAGAKKIEKQDAPQLWNVVEEMTLAAGLGPYAGRLGHRRSDSQRLRRRAEPFQGCGSRDPGTSAAAQPG